MYAIATYGVQCLAVGCRRSGAGQPGVRPERGMLHTYRLELLMMGIEVPETC